jgi:mRNA interferase RelE/StbE
MIYRITFKPRAIRDMKDLAESDRRRIMARIEDLQGGFIGDIRKLAALTPEYRLRVGDYRVLFEIEKKSVVIYRILHRKEAYC